MTTVRIPAAAAGMLRCVGQLAEETGVRAYAVGGCVRDWLLGMKTLKDTDITVEGDGIAVARRAAETLGGLLTVHEQFGTATLMVQARIGHAWSGLRLDFASCRKERYAKPAAYPRVSSGMLADDLFRRDFTMNAVAAALASDRFGRLVDPYGGMRDLRRRRLRILHARSFLDDPSRILRGIRFLRRFGLRWESGTERALQQAIAAGALGWLNLGRFERELARMSEEPDPAACFRQLAALLDEKAGAHGRRAAAD